MHPFGTMFAPCAEICFHSSTSSTVVFPARTLASPAAEQAWQESEAGYFSRSQGSLARFDLALSSWRTWQRSLMETWEPLPKRLPDCGMSFDGELYPLSMWERRILENAGFLWPTPCLPGNGGTNGKSKMKRLMAPTPNATAFNGGRLTGRKGKKNPERNNFQDFCSLRLKMRYPLPEFTEQIMGYPLGWTRIEAWASETLLFRPRRGKRLKD